MTAALVIWRQTLDPLSAHCFLIFASDRLPPTSSFSQGGNFGAVLPLCHLTVPAAAAAAEAASLIPLSPPSEQRADWRLRKAPLENVTVT